jgi:flagellar hook-basal body complex protein FliE
MKPLNLNTIENPGLSTPSPQRAEQVPGDGFGQTLENAVQKLESMQGEADVQAQQLAQGEGNLHETMLALEKADVAMRVAMKVRNKVLDAYNEVMRMPV